MTGSVQDFRYGLRQLRKNPGFTATVILVLALGIGATTGMLAVVQSVLVRPLPYRDAGRIVMLGLSDQASENPNFSYPDAEKMQRNLRQFSQIAAYNSMPVPIETADGKQMNVAPGVSTNFFDLMGVAPVLGRTLRGGDHSVAVVSRTFWQMSLHGRKDVLGSTLKVNGDVYNIVGVMPASFQFPMQVSTVWTTLDLTPELKTKQGFDEFSVIARLAPGATLEQARQEGEAFWKHEHKSGEKLKHFWVYPYQRLVTGNERPAIFALLGACFLLLLIAVVNTANLQIARATVRESEIAMRAALGASRVRLFRQMAVESVTLSLAGAVAGWFLAIEFTSLARSLFANLPRFDELRLDPWTFTGCMAITAISGVAASLGPAWYLLGRRELSIQQSSAARMTHPQRLTGTLVAAEVAFTCVLLIAAGLFLRTFQKLQNVPLGFVPESVTTFLLWPHGEGSDAARVQSYQRVIDALQHLPEVKAAGAVTTLPISNFQMTLNGDFTIPGILPTKDKNRMARLVAVTPGYFEAMRIPLLAGRPLSASGTEAGAASGVVNRAFVDKYLHGANPLGQQINFGNDTDAPPTTMIVGVVENTVQGNGVGAPILPEVSIRYDGFRAGSMVTHFAVGIAASFAVRTTAGAATANDIRNIVSREAPDLAIDDITPLSKSVQDTLRTQRLAVQITFVFGCIALALSAAGLYGVLAYLVGRRMREIGIRFALGASRRDVYALVLRQSLFMAGSGLAVGWIAALIAGRWIRTFLFGVSAHDVATYALAGLLILCVSVDAMLGPARRAAKVDPMVALRYE